MITTNEYVTILEDHGIEVRHGTHGMIEDVMVCFFQTNDEYVILWDDIGYDKEGEFTNFVNTCECYEDKELFIKALEDLKQKYKLLKIQQKMGKIDKDFV